MVKGNIFKNKASIALISLIYRQNIHYVRMSTFFFKFVFSIQIHSSQLTIIYLFL